MSDIASILPSLNGSLATQVQRHSRAHTVLPEGNTTTSAPNATGAVQSFASILSGVTSASNAARRE